MKDFFIKNDFRNRKVMKYWIAVVTQVEEWLLLITKGLCLNPGRRTFKWKTVWNVWMYFGILERLEIKSQCALLDTFNKKFIVLGGSPGLVVMGGCSCSKGREFKSRRHILDGHDICSHWFVVKFVTMFVWKDRK